MSGFDWFRANADRFRGTLLWNEPLAKHTYYRIGGPANLVIQPEGLDDLRLLHEGLRESESPFFILGLGSNILAPDDGYSGVILKTSKLNTRLEAEVEVLSIGSSVTVTSLLRNAGQRGWKGLERLAGVPGSVGGVITMNAGTHLGEAKDLLLSADVYSLSTGEIRTVDFDVESFSYRHNHFLRRGEVITESRWRLVRGVPSEIQATIAQVIQRRKASQPLEYPSCGSVFKNPPGQSAWKVIDELGLRGHRVGNAQISEKHPNFIVNLGEAKASDVLSLIARVKSDAADKLQMTLEEEVRILR